MKANITRTQYHTLKAGHPIKIENKGYRKHDQIRFECVGNFGEREETGVMSVYSVNKKEVEVGL